MPEPTHRLISANGIRIHAAECGSGPVVLLIHGFPESWYSWRHQLPALAAAGYRAVAIDVRGYGRSSKPAAVEDYRMVKIVADVVGVVGALGGEPVVLIGHDWGAPIAWTSALLRPDLFRGVAGLSVPYTPPASPDLPAPLERMASFVGPDEEFYVQYFQEVGRAEAEIEEDVRRWLLAFYYGASGDAPAGENFAVIPRGTRMSDRFIHPDTLPGWLTEADLDFYAGEFERSGFFGPLCRYRNVNRDFQDLAAFADQPIRIPALFIGGEKDGPTIWGAPAIEQFSSTLPELVSSTIVPGAGHWIQQEAPDVCNDLLVGFVRSLG